MNAAHYLTFIFDLIAALWIFTLFVLVFFCLPSRIFSISQPISQDTQIISYWVRMTLVIIVGVLFLSKLKLFNWFTLVFFLGGCLLISWHQRDRVLGKWNKVLQQLGSAVLDILDRGLSFDIPKTVSRSWQNQKKSLVDSLENIRNEPEKILVVVSIAAILTFGVLLRFEYPLRELRFTNPDSYISLLATRQLLGGEQPHLNHLPVLPALAAVVSLLGSIDAMQVIRFLTPILGILLVLSVGYCVGSLSNKKTAALVAMYSLGIYTFQFHWDIASELPNWLQQWLSVLKDSLNTSLIRQWSGGELELGAIFVLLALTCSSNATRGKYRQSALIDTLCCLVIISITAPSLLILAVVGGIGLVGGRKLVLALVTIVWVLLGLLAAFPQNQFHLDRSFLLTLPIGLSLLCGLLFIFAAWLFRLVLNRWGDTVCLVVIFALSINFLFPSPPKIDYLEYEIAARKTLELRHLFPIKSWAIAAPIEQLSESYGAGWYQDLAVFVEEYAPDAGKSDFQFPLSTPHLFIFVEKKPFMRSLSLFQTLPYSVLSDPTYRHYRSAAGRASLQFEALQMCEAYRQTHSNTSIYYEDDYLRIYHFELAGKK